MTAVRVCSRKEEILNTITHGIGVLFSITCLTLLVALSSKYGNVWSVVSCCIFGFCMMLMYTSSTVYHAVSDEEIKKILKKLDHISIYFLIAGTYTPIILVLMRNPTGWAILGFVWGLAIIGTALKLFLKNIDARLWSVSFYLLMGWSVIGFLNSFLDVLSSKALLFFFSGGILYTAGVFFYIWRSRPYAHVIWHCFVLSGSVMHFFAILSSCVFVL